MAVPTELNQFLGRLGWSPERLAREVNKLRGPGTVSAKAPYHWLRGAYPRREVPELVAKVLSHHLGQMVSVEAIWPAVQQVEAVADDQPVAARVTPTEISQLVHDSCSSARLVRQVTATNADSTVLQQLTEELAGLAASYLHVPPGDLVYRAAMLRDKVARLLGGHQRPSERRELLALASRLCGTLAWLADDLGDGHAAYNHAAAAWELADLADDNGARRWVRVAQSRQAYWSRNFVESHQLAINGMGYHDDDGLTELLPLFAARAAAAAGDTAEARRLLPQCTTGQPSDSGRLGLFDLSSDRAICLTGHVLLLLDEPEAATITLSSALDRALHLPSEERFYGSEMVTRLDLARSKARLDETEEAAELLGPVFRLGPEKIITMISVSLQSASEELGKSVEHSPSARESVQQINQLLGRPVRISAVARQAG